MRVGLRRTRHGTEGRLTADERAAQAAIATIGAMASSRGNKNRAPLRFTATNAQRCAGP
jgi:hypothetical protein